MEILIPTLSSSQIIVPYFAIDIINARAILHLLLQFLCVLPVGSAELLGHITPC